MQLLQTPDKCNIATAGNLTLLSSYCVTGIGLLRLPLVAELQAALQWPTFYASKFEAMLYFPYDMDHPDGSE